MACSDQIGYNQLRNVMQNIKKAAGDGSVMPTVASKGTPSCSSQKASAAPKSYEKDGSVNARSISQKNNSEFETDRALRGRSDRVAARSLLKGASTYNGNGNCQSSTGPVIQLLENSELDRDTGKSPKGGTTIIALVVNAGIILAADTRESYYTGSVSNPNHHTDNDYAEKIERLAKNLVCAKAGSVSDINKWLTFLKSQINAERDMDVLAAVAILVNANKRRSPRCKFDCDLFLAGVHDQQFRVYYLNASGSFRVEDLYASGSGGSFADVILKPPRYRIDLNVRQAVYLARQAIFNASIYDRNTGGSTDVYIFTDKNGDGKQLPKIDLAVWKKDFTQPLEDGQLPIPTQVRGRKRKRD